MKGIYAIYDNVAESLLGNGLLHLHAHDAPAIRMFGDVASMPQSPIALHPQDFDLIKIGVLNDDNTITPVSEIVLTGANWSAAQKQPTEAELHAS